MSDENVTYEVLDDAARRICAAYDLGDPSNLIGMMMPFEGRLYEIIDAQIVDGQPIVRLAAAPETVTINLVSTPIERGEIVNGVCTICGATNREETCIGKDGPTHPGCPHHDDDEDD